MRNKVVRAGLVLLAAAAAADALYLAWLWPNWSALARGPIPKSRFIQSYEESLVDEARAGKRELPALRWMPVPLTRIPRILQRAVILAEDARFYEHDGVDLEAMQDAVNYDLGQGRIALGGSTISQQTAKNLFLWPARSPLRKWHELVLTLAMERRLSKSRILEIYLNVAQFGRGIYGVEAAARNYWSVPTSALSRHQAAELAACLPSPDQNNPQTRSARFERRADKIERYLDAAGE
ncbi:MAG TPA: monofunctional biosynthetic peptidoglycan transglycosylase [Myxococcota bacterium]|nr:monofunctional biosynthetic peptidoglycan transglycosylase [Myxococcota bacterium]